MHFALVNLSSRVTALIISVTSDINKLSLNSATLLNLALSLESRSVFMWEDSIASNILKSKSSEELVLKLNSKLELEWESELEERLKLNLVLELESEPESEERLKLNSELESESELELEKRLKL